MASYIAAIVLVVLLANEVKLRSAVDPQTKEAAEKTKEVESAQNVLGQQYDRKTTDSAPSTDIYPNIRREVFDSMFDQVAFVPKPTREEVTTEQLFGPLGIRTNVTKVFGAPPAPEGVAQFFGERTAYRRFDAQIGGFQQGMHLVPRADRLMRQRFFVQPFSKKAERGEVEVDNFGRNIGAATTGDAYARGAEWLRMGVMHVRDRVRTVEDPKTWMAPAQWNQGGTDVRSAIVDRGTAKGRVFPPPAGGSFNAAPIRLQTVQWVQ